MSTLRISDAPLLPDVDGTEKIPTGGRGDYAISVNQIKDHIFEDIGKELVGLGNVDNTSDLDKPISTAQQAALDLKADKTYVDTNLNLKADKTNVYTRSETTLALSKKADLVGGVIPENQIPSSFNNVLEFATENLPIIGESGKIYITTDTNKTWRWATNKYVEISGWNPDSVSKRVTIPTYNTSNDGVDPVTGVADGAYFNVRSSNDDTMLFEYQNVSGVPTPSGKSYPSSGYVKGVAEYTAMPFDVGGEYNLNQRVQLDNGSIVKSNVSNNTTNPNIDVTGWEFTETKIVRSIDHLIGIPNPKTGQSAYMLSWHTSLNKGGGLFIYDATKSEINDAGIVVLGWVRQGVTKEIDPVIFGAKANFTDPVNSAAANDDRLAIQRAIDYLASNGGGEVAFNSGKYWVNSYTESPLSAEPTYDIIMMQPNVSFSWSGGSQVIVGNFFHDKKFHVFSGYLVGNTLLSNVHFKRPYITSILDENYKVTASHRRVAIEFRNCNSVTVKDGVIRDIELSNGIGAGISEGVRLGKNAHISGMLFLNLTKSGNLANIDHTTVYLNSEDSTVSNCSFIDTGTRGWEISCPVELHASNTSFTNSYVYGYTRGGWFVSELIDGTTSNQKIANNKGVVAHTVAQVWSVDNATLQNCVLSNNLFTLAQPSAGDASRFGYQALISTSGPDGTGGAVGDLTIEGNKIRYTGAKQEFYKQAFYLVGESATFADVNIRDNIFYGVNGGATADVPALDGFYLSGNHYITTGVAPSATTGFISIKANSVGSLSTKNNKFTFRVGRVEAVIKLQYTNANRVDLGECEYTDTYSIPVVSDYYFPDGFNTLYESQLNNTWYNVAISIPAIAANQSALVGVSMPPKGIPFASKSYFTGNFGYPVLVHEGVSCGSDSSSVTMFLTNVLPTEYAARSINVDCRIVGKT